MPPTSEKISTTIRFPVSVYNSARQLSLVTGRTIPAIVIDASASFARDYPETDEFRLLVAAQQRKTEAALKGSGLQRENIRPKARAGHGSSPDVHPINARIPLETANRVTAIARAIVQSDNNLYVTALERYIDQQRGSEELRSEVGRHLAEIGTACHALGIDPSVAFLSQE